MLWQVCLIWYSIAEVKLDMKKWDILAKARLSSIDQVIKVLLKNREIVTKQEIKEFLNPKIEKVTARSVGIDEGQLKKAVKRINSAVKNGEQIIVFGDYDVDGICGCAILWESLNAIGGKVLPYIPHRIDEGYGLSAKGIENLTKQVKDVKLIITVDNGIVANEAVDFAKNLGIDVIITDHHVPSKKLPDTYSIVHTTKLCGAGVGWILSKEFKTIIDHLELVTLATIADLVPLTGANRAIVKSGLEKLRQTQRVGLLELFRESALDKDTIGTYEIGHVIAPRLNAMGRLESAMDSLRLLCTKDRIRAKTLAFTLSSTNLQRQKFTQEALLHAVSQVKVSELGRILFIADESYKQGVIGLVAGKLVEQYYLPSIVVSKGEILSRASARSIHGLNIIEFIRGASEFLVDAGGHPMAAGFTVETTKLILLQKKLEEMALKQVTKKMLSPVLRIDCELPVKLINFKFYDELQKLAPFGMANPMPVFASKNFVIEDLRTVGREAKHLKFRLKDKSSEFRIEAIGFNMGEKISELKIGKSIDAAYTIDQDSWNGNKKLQLKIKDIKS